MAWRDSHAQRKRLVLFSLSIVAGISALVAIHSLRAALQGGVETQAKALLGSDLHIASREPFAPEVTARVATEALAVARETEFSSMLYFPRKDAARMVSVRGLEGGFPFYGQVETTPPEAWQRVQRESGILLERSLLDQFGVQIGDRVKLGALELPILGTVEKSPPRTSRFGGFAPEAYVRLAEIPRTELLRQSKLAFHHLHLKLASLAAENRVREILKDERFRIEGPKNRRESLGNALDNAEEFLGLIALAALVLGAIGVAGAIHAHVSRRVPHVAILRCLGCPGEVAFGIYLAQALALGAVAAVLGAALGVALHVGIVAWYRESLPFELAKTPDALVVLRTTLGGLVVCGTFALLPLLRVREISPGAALRENMADMRSRKLWPLYATLGLVLLALSVLGHKHHWRALAMASGLVATFAILALVALVLVRGARWALRPSWPYLLRQGIANLYRPHNQTLLFLLSLGLGTFLLLTVLLARDALVQRLNLRSLAESPSIYLVDVQPDQVAEVRELLQEHRLPVLEFAPMVTMRIKSVRGEPVQQIEARKGAPKWVLEREYRSSYRGHLVATEKIVAGEWFAGRATLEKPVPLSLEKGIADDLHLQVGDELVLDVQGISITTRIANLREVDWSKFSLNFFMVFPPGILEGAPGFHVVTTRLPAGTSSGELQRSLVREFPNVTAIDLSVILATVRSILEKVARIITILAGFTVLAGLPILAATLLNGRDQRLRESVLLRTLGASSRQVRAILLIEYATLGLLSAVTGVALAIVANALLARFIFKAEPWPDFAMVAYALAGATLLAVLGGLTLSRGVTHHPPLEVLRGVG